MMSAQTIGRLPMWLKVSLTLFVAVLVPNYLQVYGPSNFLWFCDVALVLALIAVWTEHALPASMAAVGIFILQALWALDLVAAFLGITLFGSSLYMFDEGIPLFTRLLSLYHLWLPFLLYYMLTKLGYDRRAFLYMTVLAVVTLLVCYFVLPPNQNVNYVFGPQDKPWMDKPAWLAIMMIGLPVICYLPVHLVLKRWIKD